MRISLLLHSSTGNTRLVARYVAVQLKAAGHVVKTQDIVGHPDPAPHIAAADLLVVASPTMYFRPTVAMERFVARLPALPAGERRPAWLLATCMGEPGAQFALLAEALSHKGWDALGAHYVLCPSNWPTHLGAIGWLAPTAFLRPHLDRFARPLRLLWWTLWRGGEPDARDREALDSALAWLLAAVGNGGAGRPPSTNALHRGIPTCNAQGRLFPTELLDRMTRIRIDAARCTGCGTCVKTCPVRILTQDTPEAVPEVGQGCTGCFACFNHCPEGVISATGAPAGRGVYQGPGARMREVFRS